MVFVVLLYTSTSRRLFCFTTVNFLLLALADLCVVNDRKYSKQSFTIPLGRAYEALVARSSTLPSLTTGRDGC